MVDTILLLSFTVLTGSAFYCYRTKTGPLRVIFMVFAAVLLVLGAFAGPSDLWSEIIIVVIIAAFFIATSGVDEGLKRFPYCGDPRNDREQGLRPRS